MPLKSAQLRKAYLHFLKVTGPCITNFRGKNEIQHTKKKRSFGKTLGRQLPRLSGSEAKWLPLKISEFQQGEKKKKRKRNARQKFPAFFGAIHWRLHDVVIVLQISVDTYFGYLSSQRLLQFCSCLVKVSKERKQESV